MRNTKILFWLVGLLALVIAFALLSQWRPGQQILRPADTSGWLAYVSDRDGPTHIWFMKPDGAHVRLEPGSKANDDEPTWQMPDGGTLYFTSDRTDRVSQIFRISPVDARYNQLTLGGARKSNLKCSRDGDRVLHLAGGLVSIYSLAARSSEQVIPPPSLAEADKKAMMEYWEARFGTSAFSVVAWGKSENLLAGVIRGDRDNVLVLQSIDPRQRQQQPPRIVMYAKRIDIACHPTDDVAVVAFYGMHEPVREEEAQSWEAPEVPPSHGERANGLFIVDLRDQTKGATPVFLTDDPLAALLSPSWSSTGAKIAAIAAEMRGSELEPTALLIMPAVEGGVEQATPVDEGRCGDPQWSPDGRQLAYTKGLRGRRQIWVYDVSTGKTEQITDGKGDNYCPRWSPKAGPRSE
jgi:dipeptidyl aminopeptidase/acylaminoacyl peptidase